MKKFISYLLFFTPIVAFVVTLICAWLTHIFTCFADEAWGFLIAGAIMFPVAIIHGIWIWF